MKQLYTTLLTLFIGINAFATIDKAVGNNLVWSSSGTWNLGRIPQDNDTILIPAHDTVNVDANFSLNGVVIMVYGELYFTNGKLRLDNASRVIVELGGSINGSGSNDQISIGGVFKFKGNGTPVVGYSYADNTTGTYPNGFTASTSATLPVTFQSFYIAREGNNVQLNWSTTNELNNNLYIVEKSTNAHTWSQLVSIQGAGSSTSLNAYGYTDKYVTDAVVYYRIHQVDMNGNAYYSAIRFMNSNGIEKATNIYTPSKQTIVIDFNSAVKNNVTVQVFNMSGQVIVRQHYGQASYQLTLKMVGAVSGVYAVKVSDDAGWSEVKKIAL
jgi:hypothetical protein